MRMGPRFALWAACWLLCAAVGLAAHAVENAPLADEDLLALVELKIEDAAIVARIQKGGLAFVADEGTIERLKRAGASEAALDAVRAAVPKPAVDEPTITFDDVLKLLSLGIDEDAILKRLDQSRLTVFTLSTEQVAQLQESGASERLIAALTTLAPAPAQVAEVISDVAIILDCSGSMRERTPEGATKMTVAKQVVADLVRRIPDGMYLALVIYGHEVFGRADDPRNCRAVRVARPLHALDAAGKSELASLLRGLEPTGATPIALSLRTAGQVLAKRDAYGGMILISDGLETCQGDPVAEAAALAANPKLTFGVNVVGFGVSAEEGRALESIAEAGGGTYYHAASATELAEKMSALAEEIDTAARPPTVIDTSRRALRILQPRIELSPMKEVFLVAAGEAEAGVYTKTGSITKFGDYLRIPSATQSYDVVWVPHRGRGVYLMRDFTLPERRVVDVQPESSLGMIKVDGTGETRGIFAMPAGNKPVGVYRPTQIVDTFDDVLIVPAGRYDVYYYNQKNEVSLIEEGLVVQAGQVQRLK